MKQIEKAPAAAISKGAATDQKKRSGLPLWLKRMFRFTLKLVILTAIGVGVWTYIAQVFITHANHMYPNIKDGDLVVTYKLDQVYTGKVVLYDSPKGLTLGRIVAVGGDIVDLQEGGVYTVNGETPYESVFYETAADQNSPITYPYVVPDGQYFILCDMRELMNDSREWGAIDGMALHGTVKLIIRHRGA